jgi:predicted transposase YdaD
VADVSPTELPGVVRLVEQRLEREATPNEARALEVGTYTLLGLRYPRELIEQLMPGVHTMRDSSTYQAILEEGRAEGERRALLRLGERRFGPPSQRVRARLTRLTDLERIERLTDRLLEAASWEELLAEPDHRP